MNSTGTRINLRGQQRRLSGLSAQRGGFSLIEVILATAILLASVVVLAELAGMGRRLSGRGRDLAEAQQLCEQTLNEVLIGLRPLEPQEQEPLLPTARVTAGAIADQRLVDVSDSLGPFAIDDDALIADEAAAVDGVATAKWLHSLRITPLEDHPGLAVLSVVIEQPAETTNRPVRFELSRWIDDPLATATGDERQQPAIADFAEPRGETR